MRFVSALHVRSHMRSRMRSRDQKKKENSNRMQAVEELQRQIIFYAIDGKLDILNI